VPLEHEGVLKWNAAVLPTPLPPVSTYVATVVRWPGRRRAWESRGARRSATWPNCGPASGSRPSSSCTSGVRLVESSR